MGEATIAAPLPQWANAPAVTPVARLSLQESILQMCIRDRMKMAIAGKRDIDSRPGVMITAQRGPKRFYPVQQIHTTSLCEISC